MASAVNTSKVTERRQLHFGSLEDIRADVEQLAQSREIRTLGNWSSGQVLKHLAIAMNCSIDGYPHQLPGFVRFGLRLLFKRRFLTKPMPPGFKLPAKAAALIPGPTTLDEGLHSIRQALQRLRTEVRRVANPALGPLSKEEWEQLHCRHAELHLSFLVPVA